ncbi:MAG: hypothetical protein K0R09_3680, partial [Clostridiales bacterium]|nr:hypothetical protein [Clostridiales bacterium]
MDVKKIYNKYFNGDSKKTVRNMVIIIL